MQAPLPRVVALFWIALCLLLPAACTSVRPVDKVGLIAPFEGLYREDGYAALDAVRRAIADCAPPGRAVVPLALDDSADPDRSVRALQKLLLDPAVTVVLGPWTPQAVRAAAPLTAGHAWLTPYPALQATPLPIDTTTLTMLLDAITARLAPSRILMVAPGLSLSPGATDGSDRVRFFVDPTQAAEEVTGNDAILWLGDAAQGATWYAALRARTNAPFVLGTPIGAEIFARHAPHSTSAYWLLWHEFEYTNAPNSSTPQPTGFRQGVTEFAYRSTCAYLAEPLLPAPAWSVDVVAFGNYTP